MRLASALLLLPAAACAAQQVAPSPPTLCETLRSLTQQPSVAAAHWGVSVTTLTGQPVCALNDAQLFRPASNNKLFTTAAALALLGPNHTWTTRLFAEGSLDRSTLRGNLVLLGTGDPTFGATDLPYVPPAQRPKTPAPLPPTIAEIESFADAVYARGIRTITGDIVGDDSAFAGEPYPPDWSIDDMVYGYGAPISALTIHNNAIDLTVTPGASSAIGVAPATITLSPPIPYYQLDASVYTIAFPGGCDDRLAFQRAPGAKTLAIFGDIAPTARPCRQDVAIQDPAEYAALALRLALERRGIRVDGATRAHHLDARILGGVHSERPDGDPFLAMLFARSPVAPIVCMAQAVFNSNQPAPFPRTQLASHVSPLLLTDMTFTNKVSQNQHAELYLRTLGSSYTCGNSQRDGLHVIREFILHTGVQPQDILLYDGSGLSGHDLVAPRAFTTFLAWAATQPWFAQWRATLPEGGVDGTLAHRFPHLQGRLFAKTGTLSESRALSGYVTTASGATYLFSVMVDDHLPADPDRATMDQIVEAIAAQP